jgi:hypothetical protein
VWSSNASNWNLLLVTPPLYMITFYLILNLLMSSLLVSKLCQRSELIKPCMHLPLFFYTFCLVPKILGDQHEG